MRLLLAPLTSPPQDTVLGWPCGVGASRASLRVRVMAFPDPPKLITVLLVQVTVWEEIMQLQRVPAASAGVKPEGTVSTTVMVPKLLVPPLLLPVMGEVLPVAP